jgi:hypothetical protein
MDMNLINDLFEYKDGGLYWKKSSRHGWVGKQAGTICNGYVQVRINQKHNYAHRIIFFMHHGYLPNYIDHIDGNPLNNKIENLRATNSSGNSANSKVKITNTSGYKGVSFRSDTNKWQAALTKDYKKISLGCYETAEEAHQAYLKGSKEHFGEFAR